MNSTPTPGRPHGRTVALLTAAALTMSLAACGSSEESGKVTEIGFWDPYPQYDDGSDWAEYVKSCAPEGTTIERTTAPNTDLINNLTTAVREDNAPDVVFLDNPAMPEAVCLRPAGDRVDEVGIDATDADANLAGPGTVDGETYGVPDRRQHPRPLLQRGPARRRRRRPGERSPTGPA